MTDTGFQNQNAEETGRFDNLRLLDRTVAYSSTGPRWVVYGVTAFLAGLAWIWLSILTVGVIGNSGGIDLGPATGQLTILSYNFGSEFARDGILSWLVRACMPQSPEAVNIGVYLVSIAMWTAMSVAMMLPSAAPMLGTYADIADVAAGKGEQAASIVVLLTGYLSVWLVFSVFAAGLQMIIMMSGIVKDALDPIQGTLGGGLLMLAGLYQFSSLKHACMEKCRNPFSTLFGRWSNQPRLVFKLGFEQGLFCLGCCWALMLVMFVVGTMNLVWMAFLTLFAVLEKSMHGKVASRLAGGILLVWGGILLVFSTFAVVAN